jgi:hypothetical protein
MTIKSVGSSRVRVRGHFFVRDGNKTRQFGLSSGFAPMDAGARPFFPSRVYSNMIRLFLTHFYKPDGHSKPDECECGCEISPASAGAIFHPLNPNPTH